MIGSLTFLAGLAWNDAFQALIDQYTPDKFKTAQSAWIKLGYASILTVIILVLIGILLQV